MADDARAPARTGRRGLSARERRRLRGRARTGVVAGRRPAPIDGGHTNPSVCERSSAFSAASSPVRAWSRDRADTK